MPKLERDFQKQVIRELKEMFPGCVVLKNDADYIQGFPDLTVLHGPHWAVLETKRAEGAHRRPNQEYYVGKLDKMSYAAFVNPENKESVMRDLQRTFSP